MTSDYCFSTWVWYCSYDGCKGCSIKPSSRILAKRNGVIHMRNFHNDTKTEPILIKVVE